MYFEIYIISNFINVNLALYALQKIDSTLSSHFSICIMLRSYWSHRCRLTTIYWKWFGSSIWTVLELHMTCICHLLIETDLMYILIQMGLYIDRTRLFVRFMSLPTLMPRSWVHRDLKRKPRKPMEMAPKKVVPGSVDKLASLPPLWSPHANWTCRLNMQSCSHWHWS